MVDKDSANKLEITANEEKMVEFAEEIFEGLEFHNMNGEFVGVRDNQRKDKSKFSKEIVLLMTYFPSGINIGILKKGYEEKATELVERCKNYFGGKVSLSNYSSYGA